MPMYRAYEDPYELECILEKLKKELSELQYEQDEERFISLSESINDIEQRINFAWQDDEYENQEE